MNFRKIGKEYLFLETKPILSMDDKLNQLLDENYDKFNDWIWKIHDLQTKKNSVKSNAK